MTGKKSSMTVKDASRIQSAHAKKSGGTVPKGSFPAKAMRAATKKSK